MMTNDSLLARTLRILTGRGRKSGDGLGVFDLASLQVALMVAALDGRVLPEEFRSFERLVRRCAGATPENGAAALDVAIRSAGYVLMQSFRLPERALTALFADEAMKLLPEGFLSGRSQPVRTALTMWMTMAMSDGDYSGIERACLEALFSRLHDRVYAGFLSAAETARSRSRVFISDREMKAAARERAEEFLPIDFMSRTETVLAKLACAVETAAAENVRTLIG